MEDTVYMGVVEAKEIKWYSQSGQDKFAYEVVGSKGTFLDIGCREPSSNTRSLEQMGWTGWLIDNAPDTAQTVEGRTSPLMIEDATKLDYSFLPDHVDYLSLDIDSNSLDALKALPLDRVRFKVITIEHDDYAYPEGESPRKEMREILWGHGYSLARPNVADQGLEYEDWFLDEHQ